MTPRLWIVLALVAAWWLFFRKSYAAKLSSAIASGQPIPPAPPGDVDGLVDEADAVAVEKLDPPELATPTPAPLHLDYTS